MWSSIGAALWMAITGASNAHAAACCVGATSALPTRVGECERVVAAVSVGVEHVTGSWDRAGNVLPNADYAANALLLNIGTGVRLTRRWEVNARLPVRNNHITAGEHQSTATGIGDARILAFWDPREERPPGAPGAGPSPVFIAGVRLPTGRDWTASTDLLGADITGLVGAAPVLGLQLERTMGQWPWTLSSTADIANPNTGGTPSLATAATVGRYMGSQWTTIASLSRTLTWSAEALPLPATEQTSVGLRVVRGRPKAWRAWAGIDTHIPMAGLGLSTQRLTNVALGWATIW